VVDGRHGSLSVGKSQNRKDAMKSHQIKDVRRQCGKRVQNCSEREVQIQKLLFAEGEACKKGFKGKSRFDYLKRLAGFDERTEDSQMRRMLREARRLFAKA
jgi:hypothetical protein